MAIAEQRPDTPSTLLQFDCTAIVRPIPLAAFGLRSDLYLTFRGCATFCRFTKATFQDLAPFMVLAKDHDSLLFWSGE